MNLSIITLTPLLTYRVYAQTIQINIALNLPSISQRIPDYTIHVQNDILDERQITWLHDYDHDNGLPWHRLGKLHSEYIIRFTGCADFIYNKDKSSLLCFSKPGTQLNTIEHLLLDQVLPRVLSRKDFLVFHAGAVACENGSLAFVGKTGSGKSTLTAFLGQDGNSILTDDCLVLQQVKDGFLALPSYPAIRLNSDIATIVNDGKSKLESIAEYSTKLSLNPSQGRYVSQKKPVVLRALCILAGPNRGNISDTVSIESCSMREAFSLLIGNVFRLDPTDRESSSNEFKRLNALVSNIPVYRLKYPYHQGAIDTVVQATLDLLKETH